MIDVQTDTGAYILGLLWGTMAVWEEGFWLRHRENWYIETVRNYLYLSPAVQFSHSRTGDQYRLKIIQSNQVAQLTKFFIAHGWTARQAQERYYPLGDINHRGFIRAWTELHGTADIAHIGRQRAPTPRLRVYGNYALLNTINDIITRATGLKPRAVQKTVNNITKAIYYYGYSYIAVVNWLYDGASLYNPEAKAKFLRCAIS